MGFIYKITSPSGKIYVGKTYDLRKRINSHKCAVKKGKNIILHNSIRKYGWDAHVFEVIEEVEDSLLDEREMYWIAELKTYCYENKMGLNMTKGGDGQRSTWMHKTELREWFSNKFSGEGNPFYGKTHTEETKKILSEIAKVRNKKTGQKVPKWGAEKGWETRRKSVLLYDKNGNFIKEFSSYTEAGKYIGNTTASQIWGSISGRRKQVKGWICKDKTENYPLKIEVNKIKEVIGKRPVYCLNDDLEPIFEFPSAKEASDFFGIPKTTINRAAMYNDLNPIRTGHIFIYKDMYLKSYSLVA